MSQKKQEIHPPNPPSSSNGIPSAHEELRESEKRLAALFDANPTGLLLIDPKSRIIQQANEAAARMIDRPVTDIVGKICHGFLCPVEAAQCPVCDLGQKLDRSERILIRRDGRRIQILKTVVPFMLDGKQLLLESFIDITELKQAETARQQSEIELRGILDTTADGLLAIDSQGKVIKTNQRFADLWKIPRAVLDSGDDQVLLDFVLDQLCEPEAFLNKVKALYGTADVDLDLLYFKDGRVIERYSAPLLMQGSLFGRVWSFRDITDQKTAEQRLRDSETRYRALFDVSADGILIADVETKRFLLVNPAAERMFGYAGNEWSALTLADVHPKAALAHVIAEFEAQARGEKDLAPDIPCLRKDGAVFHADINTSSFLIQGRLCNVGFFRDTTERKRAEAALRESEIQNQALIHAIPDLIFTNRRDGEYLAIHASDPRLLAASPESVLHRRIGDVLPKPIGAQCQTAIAKALDSGAVQEINYALPMGGLERHFEARIAPCTTDTAITIVRDITERMQAEETLRLFKALVDHSSDAVGLSTPDGRHYYQNPAFDRLFGAIGECPPDTLYADPAVGRQVFATIKGGADWRGEVRMFRKDRTLLDILLRAYAIRGPDGRIIGLVGLHTDISERKQAEATLQESEEKYRLFFENVDDAIYIHDDTGRILAANPAAVEQLGYAQDELLAMSASQVDAPAEAPRMPERMARLKSQGALEFETVHRRKDGSLFPVDVKAKLIQWSGRPAVMSICRDITERKQADRFLRLVLENIPDFVFWKDRNSVFLGCNNAIAKVAGLDSPDQIIGKTDYDLGWKKEESDFYVAVDRRVMENDQAEYHIIEPQLQADGKQAWLDTCKVPLHDENGKVIGILGSFMDITERREAEEAMRRHQSYLSAIVENQPGLLWLKDADSRFLAVNMAFAKSCGLDDPALLVGKSDLDIWPRELALQYIAHDADVMRSGKTSMVEELLSDKGVMKWFETFKTPIFDKQGKAIGTTGYSRDITERKQAEEEKVRIENELHQSRKMESIGRLAGGVAHDFNNMLTVILGNAELALDQVGPEQPAHADLLEIRKAAERSANLTRQLLAFARKQTIAPRILDLNETVEGMLHMLRRLIGENIAIDWRPGKNLCPIRVDPVQIDQILANLCINARDAIGGAGQITIETACATFDPAYCEAHDGSLPGDFIRLSVGDNGCGMDRETMGHLFEPFFTSKGFGKGTGLGLAMVYGIVKQNNGFIDVDSEPGRGSLFKIHLPCHVDKVVPRRMENQAEPVARGGETILLVEDEPSILQLTAHMIGQQGYTVLTAQTPGEAIRVAREHSGEIHLLMTDVVMPEMNGRALAQNLLSMYPRLKRLFMSGYTADVIAHQGVLDDGVYFIQKPFSRQDLAAMIREAIDSEKE